MDEASFNLPQTPLRSNGPLLLSGPVLIINVLARQTAIAHTKLQLKRQVYHVSHYPHREIFRQAEGARSTRDLLNVLDRIAKAGAGFRSLANQWCDTTTPHVRLMLTMLGGLAEFEGS
jgi:hypothetical protein